MPSPTRRTVRIGATAAALLTALVIPGAAHASSISISAPGTVTYSAAADEVNKIQVTKVDHLAYQGAIDLGPALKIRDTGLTGAQKISAQAPCQLVANSGSHIVLCPLGTGPAAVNTLVLNLGNKDDNALVWQTENPNPSDPTEQPVPETIKSTINGDAGDDILQGGAAGGDQLNGGTEQDLLYGGAGADTFAGGDGVDTVTYEIDSVGITANLDGVANDGADGGAEADKIDADVENLTGTPASNDSLTGDANPNVLDGRGGDDTIAGGEGADTLLCGDGNDLITSDAFDTFGDDCETTPTTGGGGTGGGGGGGGGGGTGGSTGGDNSAPSLAQQQTTLQQEAARQDAGSLDPSTPASTPASTSPRVNVSRRTVRLRRGVARVRISCAGAQSCLGTLRLALPLARGKQVTLGKVTFALQGGQRKVAAVRLTKAGRKAIARRRGATVLAIVSGSGGTSRSGFLLKPR